MKWAGILTYALAERIDAFLDNIKEAYIYGSYAQDALSAHSDLDLLVVGNYEIKTLQKKIISGGVEVTEKECEECIDFAQSVLKRVEELISRRTNQKTLDI